jgi:hypothetical protein
MSCGKDSGNDTNSDYRGRNSLRLQRPPRGACMDLSENLPINRSQQAWPQAEMRETATRRA